MEDNDIFNLFYHILDTKHFICQVQLKSNKANESYQNTPLKNGVLSPKNYHKVSGPFVETSCVFQCIKIS